MENVVAFNSELSSLYDSKPPISKAKMASITKSAMRAIKFYKHVVQSVEKFILKCKPEYKVPGLYVIDSIVRQSRHQFGPEKDVFAPRFARNIKETFANLFRCAPEDKGRIIRVLNLWQKNNVFAPEVIQPIFDLADPNQAIYQMSAGGSSSAGPSGSGGLGDMSGASSNGLNSSGGPLDMNLSGMGGSNTGHGMGEDKLGNLPDLSTLSHEKAQNVLDNSLIRHLEHKQQYLKRQISGAGSSSTTTTTKSVCETLRGSSSHLPTSTTRIHHPETYSKYTKGVHELLYHDRDRDREQKADDENDTVGTDANSPKHSSKKLLDNNNLKQLLNDPNVLRQLQTLQNFQKFKQQEEKQHKLNEMRLQEEAFEKHLQCVLKNSGPGNPGQDNIDFGKEVEFISEEQKIEVINLDGNDSRSPTPDRDRYKRRRSSRSRSRSRNRRRSRSRNRSRSPRSNRRRSRDRGERSARDKEREREHERERRKKGLPDLRKEHLSVCSTTLWVGHLSKLVYQEELSDTFGEFGDIVSIDQIVPRGCAFIVMNRRQDAFKAMQALKNHKLQGRAITISWAAGKGVKSKEWKDFWDLELGVTYIPWNKLDESTDLDSLEEGGMFDEDSMPNWMKDKIHHIKSLKEKINEPAPPSMQVTNIPPPTGGGGPGNLLFGIDTTQPPPGPPPSMMSMSIPGQFQMAPPMGGPPRMLGPPMGMPIPAPGMPMPPNMVPGMPPPHPMMGPMGMMPPGFPPMPGGVGAPSHMGIAPGGTQFPPPPVVSNSLPPNAPNIHASSNVISADDQMDIEMEDADEQAMLPVAPPSVPVPGSQSSQLSFNQPPPIFGNSISVPGTEQNINSGSSSELFGRDRNRGSANSTRWSGRSNGGDDDVPGEGNRWREGNNIPQALSGPNGMPPNFNDNRGPGRAPGSMNIPPLDINNPPQRPEFMGEFDNRMHRGGGRGGGNHNGDFFPNMQNRFNQPTSLMQMRIPPPNAFNSRMGGPSMFMRGGQGGPGNRQGPGFFNPRNPFDRDVGPMLNMRGGRGGGRGRGGRGGPMGGPSGPPGSGNWSDEEIEDNFKRRGGGGGGGGPSGNRFRDRGIDSNDERRSGNDRNVGSRRGGRGSSRERSSDRERSRDRSTDNRRRSSRDDRNRTNHEKKTDLEDTEEDWDAELKEYDLRNETAPVKRAASPTIDENVESDKSTKISEIEQSEQKEEPNSHGNDAEDAQLSNSVPETSPSNTASTALYDELPAPVAESVEPESVCETVSSTPTIPETEEAHAPVSEATRPETPQLSTSEGIEEKPEVITDVAIDVAPETNAVEAPPVNGEENN